MEDSRKGDRVFKGGILNRPMEKEELGILNPSCRFVTRDGKTSCADRRWFRTRGKKDNFTVVQRNQGPRLLIILQKIMVGRRGEKGEKKHWGEGETD